MGGAALHELDHGGGGHHVAVSNIARPEGLGDAVEKDATIPFIRFQGEKEGVEIVGSLVGRLKYPWVFVLLPLLVIAGASLTGRTSIVMTAGSLSLDPSLTVKSKVA